MSRVDCELGFSILSRIKTDLRNYLNNSTLDHLLMMSIEGPLLSDFPATIHAIFGLARGTEEFQLLYNYKHKKNFT